MKAKFLNYVAIVLSCLVAVAALFWLRSAVPARASSTAGPATIYLPLVRRDVAPPTGWILFSSSSMTQQLETLMAVNVQTHEVKTYPVQSVYGNLMPQAGKDGENIVLVQDGKLKIFDTATAALNPVPLPEGILPADPAFSPDGKRIALTDGATNIYWTDTQGSNFQQLTYQTEYFLYGLDWSPDGKTLLAYAALRAGPSYWDLAKINFTGGALTILDLGAGMYPAWSPDGRQIACSIRGMLTVMDADGAAWRSLPPTQTGSIAWSMDGNWLAYQDAGCETHCIKIIRADGQGEPIFVLDDPGIEVSLSWMP